ncbi:unnamed protein product, partial [Brenthis ino]
MTACTNTAILDAASLPRRYCRKASAAEPRFPSQCRADRTVNTCVEEYKNSKKKDRVWDEIGRVLNKKGEYL